MNVIILAAGLLAQVHAAVVGASLSGTVTDATGAVLPAATVTVRNRAVIPHLRLRLVPMKLPPKKRASVSRKKMA